MVGCGTVGDIGIIGEADERHGFVIVVLRTEGVGEDGDVDHWRKEGDDVACKHGIAVFPYQHRRGYRNRKQSEKGDRVGRDLLGAGAIDRKVTIGLLSCDKPGDQRAREPEDGAERCGDGILFAPHQSEGCWEDGGRDNDAHHEVQVTDTDPDVYCESGQLYF